jgi:hypothetical protein
MATRRRRRGRPEIKWEKEAEMVMNQRTLTSGDAVNRQLRRLKTSNRRTAGKQIDRCSSLTVTIKLLSLEMLRNLESVNHRRHDIIGIDYKK